MLRTTDQCGTLATLLLAGVALLSAAAAQQAPPQPATPPGDTVQVPLPAPAGQVEKQNGGFVIRTDVREVVLHATVVDDRMRLVTTLGRDAFTVYEDGQEQRITSFRREDIPVAMGIVVDNSGSMRTKRDSVNQAALNLVRASNPQDEVFIVNFNDDYYLDQDFTSKISLLKDALERIETRGTTALYDALIASSDHVIKNARLQKKVLLVVTDGDDDASVSTLEETIRKLAVDGGPTIYCIGILGGEDHEKRARRALRLIAEQTGGEAFFPKNIDEVDAITRQIAHDIRNQYTLGYRPSNTLTVAGYRTVSVKATGPGFKHLQVRTRSGYYYGSETKRTSPAGN